MHLTLQIQQTLRLYGQVSEDELMKKVYKDLSLGERQFYETLNVLAKAGIIRPVRLNPGEHPRKWAYELAKVKKEKKGD
jgi:hypothetical protein